MSDWHLGEKTSYPTSYDSSLLVPISRLDSRQKSGLNERRERILLVAEALVPTSTWAKNGEQDLT